ncbi:MAG: ParB/RepB/Spo0J family partition protein [Rhodospirillales bacterium]|nr:ParB/RepB/Spo0J family partition protein [Rhodospirillales bacterium]MCB9997021.1 ParB/RepB/Spo0J family partition protein [Rhodospirillales bacterium]
MSDEMKSDVKPDPKKRGLGRGLNALFEDEEGIYPQADPQGHTPGTARLMVGVDQLEPGTYQPRRKFSDESINELAESIAVHGVLQPLIVRQKPGFDGTYEIIAGERRWRASQKAQLHEVPVIVKELDDGQALEIALIENLQREDLNPVEEALGYQQLIEEFGHTQEKAAAVLGKSRSHVANMIRLLSLPRKVMDMVRDGKLSAGHARTLVTAENPEELANIIVSQGLSVREAERLAADKSGRTPGKRKSGSKAEKDVDTLALEDEITNALGMKVSIDVKGQGTGALKIRFETLDQLDDLLHRLSHFPGRQQAG